MADNFLEGMRVGVGAAAARQQQQADAQRLLLLASQQQTQNKLAELEIADKLRLDAERVADREALSELGPMVAQQLQGTNFSTGPLFGLGAKNPRLLQTKEFWNAVGSIQAAQEAKLAQEQEDRIATAQRAQEERLKAMQGPIAWEKFTGGLENVAQAWAAWRGRGTSATRPFSDEVKLQLLEKVRGGRKAAEASGDQDGLRLAMDKERILMGATAADSIKTLNNKLLQTQLDILKGRATMYGSSAMGEEELNRRQSELARKVQAANERGELVDFSTPSSTGGSGSGIPPGVTIRRR